MIRREEKAHVTTRLAILLPDGGTGARFKRVVVFEERGCIVLPPDSPLIGKGPLDLNDLEGQPLVTSPKGAEVRNNLELNFQKYGYTPNIVCESNDMELLIKAVLGGLGFAFMPHIDIASRTPFSH